MAPVIAGRFELLRHAGEGAMGVVWEARDLDDGTTVALKVLHADVRGLRFDREASLLAELVHPRIVHYIAHGTSEQGERYLAMEWLSGLTLKDLLQERTLDTGETIAVARSAAEGLAAAHAAGVVHRDLKPSNLMLIDGDLGRLKLVDFGLARRWGSPSMTASGTVFGTPAYMSPEQVRGLSQIDARSDVFSLGCVLYECLTGAPPFAAESVAAVFAKIIYAEVPPVTVAGEPLLAPFDDLLMSMLSPDPDQRPRDGQAVLAALDRLDLPAHTTGRRGRALSTRERRFACILLGPAVGFEAAATLVEVERNLDDSEIEHLADGSLLGVFREGASPADMAVRCARRALELRALYPRVALALALGHADLSQRQPIGEGIERAAALPVAPGVICLDDPTAALLAGRFVIDGDAGARRLVAESAAVAAEGRASGALFGRERELLLLETVVAHAIEESHAAVSLVIGPAGIGKSRLRRELVARAGARFPELAIWSCSGDVVRAGSPHALARDLIAGALGLREHADAEVAHARLRARLQAIAPPAEADWLTEFLGELAGVSVAHAASPQLRAARADGTLMAAQTLRAFVDWLGHEEEARPILIVVDDLHWGDRATARLLEAARRRWHERRLAFVAFTRPEAGEAPSLWTGEGSQVITLEALSRRAAARLVRARMDAGVDDAVVRAILDRGEGNAFLLEELARAARAGERAPPASVLGLLHARLGQLAPEARLLLRAAAVFGESFWRGGVAALVGKPEEDVEPWLAELARLELITPREQSRFAAEPEHAFRHSLLRDAAYALLTKADRTLGHRLAGEWLAAAGESDPVVLAEHFEQGDRRDVAAVHWAAATELALQASELDAVHAYAERGLACAPPRELEVRLRIPLLEATYFGRTAAEFVAEAATLMDLEPVGTEVWFRAAAVLAFPADGWAERTIELGRRMLALGEPATVTSERVVAEARVAGCLISVGAHRMGEELLVRAEKHAAQLPELEPRVAAELAWPRGAPGIVDPVIALGASIRARAAYEECGNARSVAIQHSNVGEALMALGAYDEAVPILESSVERCRAIGVPGASAIARMLLAAIELTLRPREAAIAALRDAARAPYIPRDYLSFSQVYEARALLALRRPRDARAAADHAAGERTTRAAALAVRAAADLQEGQVAAALAASEEAYRLTLDLDTPVFGDAHVKLVRGEALAAAGSPGEARAVVRAALDFLRERASRLEREDLRAAYLGVVPEHARLATLVAELEDLKPAD